jgi:hypothetical protein
MKKLVLGIGLALLPLLAGDAAVDVVHHAYAACKTTGTCNACKNCRYCKPCAKNGKTCSVCR